MAIGFNQFLFKCFYYFVVIPKQVTPPTDMEGDESLLPQWAVAMITIGMLSLVCVIMFGLAVV